MGWDGMGEMGENGMERMEKVKQNKMGWAAMEWHGMKSDSPG